MKEIRLQKFLSERGVASRREAERLILAGEIRVNGVVVRELGTQVDPSIDVVSYLGRPLPLEQKLLYYLLHKPKNIIVTRKDPQKRRTVYQLIPNLHPSVHAVGRLDYDSEGLLLLTNDGELTYQLTHPSFEIKKVYRVQLNDLPQAQRIKELEKGIFLGEEKTAPARIELLTLERRAKEIWLSVEIHEGKKRQVRRMFEGVGCKVLRLIRVKFGGIELGDLPVGKWRELERKEVLKLRREVAKENE